MRTHHAAALTIALLLGACSGADDESTPAEREPTWLELRDVDEEPPSLLSEVGLYGALDDLDDVNDSAVRFEPDWPLWSNGLSKSRYIALPEGEQVEVDETWRFPAGALLFKTFEDDDGPVETRVMWNSPDEGWQWYAYVWSEDGADAERTDPRRSVDVEVTVDGEEFTHTVPNEIDCRTCHEPDANGVLGFEPLQLGEAAGELDVFDETPDVELVAHDDDATRELLGWFVGNCTSCHNGSTDHDQSSFDLSPDVALENIIDVRTESSASVDGVRVVPGAPDESVLFLAVSGESDDPELKEMPPVGVQRRDEVAVEQLRDWIESLR